MPGASAAGVLVSLACATCNNNPGPITEAALVVANPCKNLRRLKDIDLSSF